MAMVQGLNGTHRIFVLTWCLGISNGSLLLCSMRGFVAGIYVFTTTVPRAANQASTRSRVSGSARDPGRSLSALADTIRHWRRRQVSPRIVAALALAHILVSACGGLRQR